MIVGLTGGIGSGKSTVASLFKDLGVPIYTSDIEAKRLMVTSSVLRDAITNLLGKEAYINNILNRPYIAKQIFNDSKKRKALNNLVHPAVAQDFTNWTASKNATYVMKEAAILFENGGYRKCDYMILVTAPRSIRIQRVIRRDESTEKEVLKRMDAQWDDGRKIALSDAVIENIDLQETKKRVAHLHRHILRRCRLLW